MTLPPDLRTNQFFHTPGDLALLAGGSRNSLTFTVYGKPEPAGSKRGFPFRGKDGRRHVAITDANSKAKPWKAAVSCAAQDAFHGDLIRGPVGLLITFWLPRPKGHFGTGRNAWIVKQNAAAWPIGKPDLLKLTRAIEDALTGVVWFDDAQIVGESLTKCWTSDGGYTTQVTIIEIQE